MLKHWGKREHEAELGYPGGYQDTEKDVEQFCTKCKESLSIAGVDETTEHDSHVAINNDVLADDPGGVVVFTGT